MCLEQHGDIRMLSLSGGNFTRRMENLLAFNSVPFDLGSELHLDTSHLLITGGEALRSAKYAAAVRRGLVIWTPEQLFELLRPTRKRVLAPDAAASSGSATGSGDEGGGGAASEQEFGAGAGE